ncbi:MAG TPA: DUF3089 domain-containing protein [Acidimicrobiales bacterium]|nr:DUF3089 domain-containing protein [Acidimicrobiales bacterium]
MSTALAFSPPDTGAETESSVPWHAVWLCKPGQVDDPCVSDLTVTSVTANGTTKVVPAANATSSRFDCFYVYPTVSTETSDNADLTVQPAERGAAEAQVARFSQVCHVWAPMYRQRTELSLAKGLGGDPTADTLAYQSLLSAWKDYLAHDNHGRPVIFIGHSQGAAMLIRLIHHQIDPSASLRKLMVSAIILGGNVQVPVGRDVGGSFQHIPICGSAAQTGCVIAYSTFGSTPPRRALFGRPGQGVSLQSDQRAKVGQQVACVNPVNFTDSSASLLPDFLTASSHVSGVPVSTAWVTYPGLYAVKCESLGGATWLQVDARSAPGDPRPKVTAVLGPKWGYHLDDVNLALGNLVLDVAVQESAHR